MKPLLSILVPTIVGREGNLSSLYSILLKQIKTIPNFNEKDNQAFFSTNEQCSGITFSCGIEVLYYLDNKEMTIGEKRERLYHFASGKYSIMIDDDDKIADNAIELILDAIKSNPEIDVVTFQEYINMDGVELKSNHSATYKCWEGDGNKLFEDGFHFHRTPYFKSVIKTELAKSVPIPHIRWGEDNLFADALLPYIQKEVHIDSQIYKYIHISSPFNERYGINKD